MKESTTRWISTGVAGALWGTIVGTATVIQPHIQVFQTVWLATLIASLVVVTLWMTRPDHGRLAEIRLESRLARLEGAIKEEADGETDEEAGRKRGPLKSVV